VTAFRPRLVVHEPGGRRVVSIDRPVIRIGRAADADLQLGGADISREHALLLTDADGYLLRDQSRAGTFVNSERISERRLVHGDEIECGRGNAVLMFLTTAPDSGRGVVLQPADLRPLATLLASLRAMGGERVLDEVLAMVLDAAIDASGADRGFILLGDAAGRLDMQMARAAGQVTLTMSNATISRKIPEQVFASGEATVVADLLEGELAAVHTGTVALGIRHVLCVPLRLVRYVERAGASSSLRSIGVLYLDSRVRGRLLADTARQEIEALAGEAAAAIENARLYEQALEKARIDRELETASRIQRALLPEPRRAGPFFDAVGASIPSRTISGDFFDYQDAPDGRFGVAMGDITGKGPPAALLTALVQGVLAAQAQSGQSPEAVVALLNRVLLARPIESRFVTMFLGGLAPDGQFDYCNAGQTPPLLFSAGTVTRLETGGTLIGAFPEAAFERGVAQLRPGDTLVLYSDGVSEAQDDEGEEFGEAGIRAAVAAAIDRSPQAVLDALFAALRNFTSASGDHDDMTAVVLRYR
jgi:phosphoserine phosphatase RsbU/P